MLKIPRYDLGYQEEDPTVDPAGEWCKWEDVLARVKHLETRIDSQNEQLKIYSAQFEADREWRERVLPVIKLKAEGYDRIEATLLGTTK